MGEAGADNLSDCDEAVSPPIDVERLRPGGMPGFNLSWQEDELPREVVVILQVGCS